MILDKFFLKYEGEGIKLTSPLKKIPSKDAALLWLKNFNDSKAFIEYSYDMDDIYKNITEYNPNKKRKILNFLDDMLTCYGY